MTFIEVVINTFLEFLEDSIKEFLSWLVKCLISIHISHPYSLPEAYSFILALLIVGKDGEKEWKVMSDDEKFESVSLNRIDRNTKSCFGNRLYAIRLIMFCCKQDIPSFNSAAICSLLLVLCFITKNPILLSC
ncbi:hypothetical protein MtrunA17_Chr8g0370751 [Medicago truncatula]|uniref:Uncharacterized protein n=1 Tax=Medicago truncatula TaxID=3880 RepID=A0A396GNX3_MEDTR|nr:hypothetical protein MtrunA17_Chr8g0370751 [Medicago truncatula]